MSADKTDYDKIVKGYISMRLMESGWTDQLGHILKSAISKRVAEGQAPKNIKLEQLYNDAIDKARVPNELDIELHKKMGEDLAVKNGTSSPGGLSEASDTLENRSNIASITSPASETPSDTSSEAISTENE